MGRTGLIEKTASNPLPLHDRDIVHVEGGLVAHQGDQDSKGDGDLGSLAGKPVNLVELSVSHYLLARALANLIENALRYGGTASVSLTRDGQWAVLAVEDEGPGIPPEDVAAMLEPFRRGEASRNRGTGGAGLGLTITRAIMRDHDGELLLANRPGGGLRAQIRLPVAR